MPVKINACSLSCPEPVLLTRNAILKKLFPVQVLIDSQVTKENIVRLCKKEKVSISFEPMDDRLLCTIDTVAKQ